MKASTFLLFVLLALGATSCAHYSIIHNQVNVPLLKEKKELQLNGNLGFRRTELQSAYALTDKIGLMANGYFQYAHGNFGEVGVGRYWNFGDRHQLEMYTGLGMGKSDGFYSFRGWDTYYYREQWEYSSSFVKAFFQVNYGYRFEDFTVAYSLRANGLHINKYEMLKTYGDYERWASSHLSYQPHTSEAKRKNIPGFILDHSLTTTYSENKISPLIQVRYSNAWFDNKKVKNLLPNNIKPEIPHIIHFQLTVGVKINIGTKNLAPK